MSWFAEPLSPMRKSTRRLPVCVRRSRFPNTPPPPRRCVHTSSCCCSPTLTTANTATMQARNDKVIPRQLRALIWDLNPASAGVCLSLLHLPSVLVPYPDGLADSFARRRQSRLPFDFRRLLDNTVLGEIYFPVSDIP